MLKQIEVCDVCEDPARPITRYLVVSGDRENDTVRCDEHGAEFEAVLRAAPKAAAKATPAKAAPPRKRAGRKGPAVVSMAEVEAAKRR